MEDGIVTGSVRIVVTSECCGDELKESNFDVEVDLTNEIEDALEKMIKLDHPNFDREKKLNLSATEELKVTSTWGMVDDPKKPGEKKFGELPHDARDNKSGITFEITDESAETTDRSETTKTKTLKSGRVVTRNIPYRYQRHFYGCDVSFTVVCEYPYKGKLYRAEVAGEFKDEVQASGMDELT